MVGNQPDPETVLQPSMHRVEEYASLLADEARYRGVETSTWDRELEGETDPDIINDVIWEIIRAIEDLGYPIWETDDTLFIYPRGWEWGEEGKLFRIREGT